MKKVNHKFISIFIVLLLTIFIGYKYTINNNNKGILVVDGYDWIEISKLENTMLDPEDFWIQESTNTAIIFDPAHDNYPVYRIDLQYGNIINRIRSGQGPGEVHPSRSKRLSFDSQENIYLWDSGLQRTTIYDSGLNYKGMLKWGKSQEIFYHVGLINDSTLFVITGDVNEFIKLYRINNQNVQTSEALVSIPIYYYEQFIPLENILLKQKIVFSNHRYTCFLAFEYAFLIISLTETGITALINGPLEHPLPESSPQMGGIYALPDLTEHSLGILDITADDNHIYVLYSGKFGSKRSVVRYMLQPGIFEEELEHSDKIIIFDRVTGELAGQYRLPVPAKRIRVHNDKFYVLTSYRTLPIIIKYEKPVIKKNRGETL